MPVSEQTPVNSYTGNGVTTVFAYTFKIIAAADIEVTVDGVVKTLTTDYSVSGVGADGGGNVTFISAPANGTTVVIQRAMAYERATDYQENGDLPAQTLDDDLDRGVMLLQQLKATLTRSIKLPAGETTEQVIAESAAARALKLLGFDAGGDVTVYGAADVDLATVSAYMLTLLDDATAADARATLGAWGGASADIASATTVDLTAATGNLVRITGTTATTGVTINNGQVVLCYPTGAWPLTYNATTMPIKGGVSYTCAAGDTVIFSKDGNGTLHVDIVPVALHPAIVSQVAAEAGTDTTARLWTAERVAQAIAALGGSGITIGPFTDWTSGAYKDITGLPVGAKRITISPKSFSTTGSSNLLIQIGDATGGLKTSGYTSGCTHDNGTRVTSTAGMIVTSVQIASEHRTGTVVLTLVDESTNAWVSSGQMTGDDGIDANSGGQVTLSGPLDRFRFTTVGGTDTGDAGGFGYSVEV